QHLPPLRPDPLERVPLGVQSTRVRTADRRDVQPQLAALESDRADRDFRPLIDAVENRGEAVLFLLDVKTKPQARRAYLQRSEPLPRHLGHGSRRRDRRNQYKHRHQTQQELRSNHVHLPLLQRSVSGSKISSIGILNRREMRKASGRLGSYLPISIALTVWRETSSRWARSACVQSRSARKTFRRFFTSTSGCRARRPRSG